VQDFFYTFAYTLVIFLYDIGFSLGARIHLLQVDSFFCAQNNNKTHKKQLISPFDIPFGVPYGSIFVTLVTP